jgi:hypothetical protein
MRGVAVQRLAQQVERHADHPRLLRQGRGAGARDEGLDVGAVPRRAPRPLGLLGRDRRAHGANGAVGPGEAGAAPERLADGPQDHAGRGLHQGQDDAIRLDPPLEPQGRMGLGRGAGLGAAEQHQVVRVPERDRQVVGRAPGARFCQRSRPPS